MEKAVWKTKNIFINKKTVPKGAYSTEKKKNFLLNRTEVLQDKVRETDSLKECHIYPKVK